MTQSHEDYEWECLQKRIEQGTPQADPVNNPEHYNQGGIECIDAIKASMSAEEFAGYLKGNVQKYVFRYRNKGNPVQDLAKAKWYLDRLQDEVAMQEVDK